MVGADLVELGFVESLGRPKGNMTGVTALAVGTVAKRLQLAHELVPAATEIAFLRNPTNPNFSALGGLSRTFRHARRDDRIDQFRACWVPVDCSYG